jgi:hypothetical protein
MDNFCQYCQQKIEDSCGDGSHEEDIPQWWKGALVVFFISLFSIVVWEGVNATYNYLFPPEPTVTIYSYSPSIPEDEDPSVPHKIPYDISDEGSIGI